MNSKIVIVGAGVAGINAATKLVDNGYPGELILIIDKGKDPYRRTRNEIMEGFNGAGAWSDSKLTRSIQVGGLLDKYCGEDKAYELMDQSLNNFKRFHPNPDAIRFDEPLSEPDFIKPYFNLRLFPVWHFGTDYLQEIGQRWYDYLISKNINFIWEANITDIDFDNKKCHYNLRELEESINFDKLIYATGKSGIKFTQSLINKYKLPTESKPIQIGIRFETEHEYLEDLIKIAYDYKLYQKPNNQVSLRTFCSNSYAAFVALETYDDVVMSNGHAKKNKQYYNNKTNFGIIMEIKGEENPYNKCMEIVNQCQGINSKGEKTCLYYSPNPNRNPPIDSEGNILDIERIYNLDRFNKAFGVYAKYITNFIEHLKLVFPNLKNDWGIFIPEAKFLTDEIIVNYNNLSLINYPDIYFAGDALSARGITVSGSQGIYCAESILRENDIFITK